MCDPPKISKAEAYSYLTSLLRICGPLICHSNAHRHHTADDCRQGRFNPKLHHLAGEAESLSSCVRLLATSQLGTKHAHTEHIYAVLVELD